MYRRFGDPSWESNESAELSRTTTQDSPPVQGSTRTRSAGSWRGAAPSRLPTVSLRGLRLHAITESTCVSHIISALDERRGGTVVTPNLDHLRRYGQDLNFGALVSEADLVVADGMPLVWASRLQGTPLPERVAGSNLISSLSEQAAKSARSIFLLGGAPGTAEAAAVVLSRRYPGLKIAGTCCPPPGFEEDPAHMADLIQSLSSAQPDIVFVALGSPKQEMLIARLRHVVPHAWWLGVGISFSFLCGHVSRAPRWMQKSGLEWAHRLGSEPRRLFKRYLMLGVPYACWLLSRSAMKGMPRHARRLVRGRKPVLPDVPENASLEATQAIEQILDPAQVLADLRDKNGGRASATPGPAAPSHAPTALTRLRALVLLGGSVRPSALSNATGRSSLDLPLDENGSLLNHWLGQAKEVAKLAGVETLPVRVMVNHGSHEPSSADPKYFGTFRVERDLSEYRGTGGVLRDLAADYADDDLILVATGRQILLDPLAAMVSWLGRLGGDISVIAHEDGTPSGLMLVRCKTLRLIADAGFVDMKEQALPLIAQHYDVRIGWRRRPTGLPIRSLEDYVLALRWYHRRRARKAAAIDPLAEDWAPSFALVEPGAVVDPSARLHDSVVLAGATIEPGAVLVRSMVCAQATVRRDKTAVDQLVSQGPETRVVHKRRPHRASKVPLATGAAMNV